MLWIFFLVQHGYMEFFSLIERAGRVLHMMIVEAMLAFTSAPEGRAYIYGASTAKMILTPS